MGEFDNCYLCYTGQTLCGIHMKHALLENIVLGIDKIYDLVLDKVCKEGEPELKLFKNNIDNFLTKLKEK